MAILFFGTYGFWSPQGSVSICLDNVEYGDEDALALTTLGSILL